MIIRNVKSFGSCRGRSPASHASAARCPRFVRRRGVSPTGAVPRNAKPSALATTAHVFRPIAAAAAAVAVIVVPHSPSPRERERSIWSRSPPPPPPLTAASTRSTSSSSAAAALASPVRRRRPRIPRSPQPQPQPVVANLLCWWPVPSAARTRVPPLQRGQKRDCMVGSPGG